MKANLKFYPASVSRPEKSGWYLCVAPSGIIELPYSKRHEKWNCFDFNDSNDSTAYPVRVCAWAELTPEFRKMQKWKPAE